MATHHRKRPFSGPNHRPFSGPNQRPLSGPNQKPFSRLKRTLRKATQHLTSSPALSVVSINIEGFSKDKSVILSEICLKENTDVLCVQETHRNSEQTRPEILGFILAAEIPHSKHGSAVFVRPSVKVESVQYSSRDSIEIITLDLGNCTVTSVYKPPGVPFHFHKPCNFDSRSIKIVVGDFNSHSSSWGYRDTDTNGQLVEEWADAQELTLIHDSKLPSSFNSSRWKRGYNPDLIFASSHISQQCMKTLCHPIPKTQHRPIQCHIQAVVRPINVPFKRRFNYAKANWEQYALEIDVNISNISPTPGNYDEFVNIIATTSRKLIPRGCRTAYIPGLSREAADLYKQYDTLFNSDPFSARTIQIGEELMTKINERRREKWTEIVTKIDLTHNSKKAWSTIRKLTGEPPHPSPTGKVTANQVAHQLILNGKPPQRLKKTPKDTCISDHSDAISRPFSLTDIIEGIKSLKIGKATGADNISAEQLKKLGPTAVSWLLELFNNCLSLTRIPRLWRKSKVIAILKPGKPSDDPKSYRPISLLCHTYKLFERMLLNRLVNIVDPKLIPEQAGFRPGKSCCNQTLNLTQHLEDGFELGQVTGVVFVDLSAAYDTVNLKRLLWKVNKITQDKHFTNILSELLHNRRFQVHLLDEKSRWRSQKNGLPQGSVLAPLLFNIYTNDQPKTPNTTRFLYADDLALASQAPSFGEVESHLTKALEDLGSYYANNSLKPNPSKTQTCVFHLRNRDANKILNISWQNTPITHCRNPKYLGITLDRALTYRQHCTNTKMKVHARNNILRRLTSTKWGASPHVLRTTGMALCYSAGEYASPVWSRSAHTNLVDTALNDTCRIITGCLKPTPVGMLYSLAGIAPPDVRRHVASSIEKAKMETDPRHPMHQYTPVPQRLKSRHSLVKDVLPLRADARKTRVDLWESRYPTMSPNPTAEKLPPGHSLPWPTWKSLNRLRTQVGRCNENMCRWGYSTPEPCECGILPQTMAHLMSCPACPATCTREDLYEATDNAVCVAEYWSGKI